MQESATVPPDEAARTLEQVRTTRSATRERLGPYWFGLVVFGVLTMVSSFLTEVWDGGAIALFWVVAGPVGWFVVARHQRAERLATGAANSGRGYAISAVTITACAIALGAIGGVSGEAAVTGYGIPLAIAFAYLVFAWLHRSPGLAVWAAAITALTVLAVLLEDPDIASTLLLVLGLRFLMDGLIERWPERLRWLSSDPQ